MATRSQRRPTPEQRDARRREQLEQLREATSALLTSEGWQRWLRTRSRFHRYSLRNTLLIAFQCPHATHVAGFRRWLELGRCVRKGEKAIRIFAPVRYRRRDTEQTDADKNRASSSSASSSPPSSTSPRPSRCPASSRHRSNRPASRSAATATPTCSLHSNSTPPRSATRVSYEPLDGRAGYCSAREARIVIDTALPANGKVATLVHELAHAHGIDYKTLQPRRSRADRRERRLHRLRERSASTPAARASPTSPAGTPTRRSSGSSSSPARSTRSPAASNTRSTPASRHRRHGCGSRLTGVAAT